MVTVLKKIGGLALKHTPTLLTAASTGFTLGAVYFAGKELPKAKEAYVTARANDTTKLPSAQTLIATVKECPGTILMTTGAIGCHWGANTINLRRLGTLGKAYGRVAIDSYNMSEKAKAVLGEAGVATVLGATASKSLKPSDDPEEFDENGELLHWFYDTMSDVWMRKSWLQVKDAYELLRDDYDKYSECALNSFYRYLGAPDECYKVDPYDELGWAVEYLAKAIGHCDFVPIEYGECYFEDGVTKGYSITFPCPPVVFDPTGEYDIFDYRYAWPMVESSQ